MQPDAFETLKSRIKTLEQSEKRLKNQIFRFQHFLNAVPFGIYIVNKHYEIEYTNAIIEKEFGRPEGRKCHQYFHDLERACPWCKNDRVFNGESVTWHWYSEKTQREYELFDMPIQNDDGSMSKLEIFKDITALKKLEQKQLQAKSLLEKVYESLDQAVFAINPEDRTILSCNTASQKIFGYTKEEMIGKNTRFLHVSPQAYCQYGKKLDRALASGTEFHTEFILKKKDGKPFPTAHIVKSVSHVSGLPSIHVTVIKDLTFRKLAQEKLAHQQEELQSRAQRLEELNATLKVLLDQRAKEKKALETGLAERLNGFILPTLNQLKHTGLSGKQEPLFNALEANIKEMITPVNPSLSDEMMRLSPGENTIAGLIKLGYRTKEIAEKMGVSVRTIEFHRDNIRKKLNIKGRKVNLRTYLSRLS